MIVPPLAMADCSPARITRKEVAHHPPSQRKRFGNDCGGDPRRVLQGQLVFLRGRGDHLEELEDFGLLHRRDHHPPSERHRLLRPEPHQRQSLHEGAGEPSPIVLTGTSSPIRTRLYENVVHRRALFVRIQARPSLTSCQGILGSPRICRGFLAGVTALERRGWTAWSPTRGSDGAKGRAARRTTLTLRTMGKHGTGASLTKSAVKRHRRTMR
jgi:hypothetical protein